MRKSTSSGLSKSLILKGLQCPRALWLTRNPPEFDFPPQPERDAKFRAGTEVGQLAQQLFPGGIEVPYEGLTVPAQLARTRELIDQGAPVIYEASFSFSAIFVKVDILVRDGDSWQIHEVKMGTSVKDVNLDYVAVQHYVLTGCGLSISRSFLVHIDNSYLRQGEIDVQQLFHSEEISAKVAARQQGMPEIVNHLRETLRENNEPRNSIGPWCNDPYECDFIPWCWRHIPEQSIFDLSGRGIDKFALYRRGILHYDEIPLDELNTKQRQQVEALLNHEDSVNLSGLEDFLAELWYPLCHLDFETFSAPIPPFDDTRPYQQIPFQFSIHRQSVAGGCAEHFEFLAAPHVDPRRELAEQLLAAIPADACVLTYNQAFEKRVLTDLAELFPDLAAELTRRIENIRDLMVPFRRRDVYRWQMNGSYSIKKVLPALVPDLSYAGMTVADGNAAMAAYHEMCSLEVGEVLEKLRTDLLAYCRMDTLAMVRILEELQRLAAEEKAAGEG
ncbi:MAG: DUF2779 domain-containing protein [Desulfuromonas sp.]|nr:MAG: DUF2779 domain-containing protein [Desulfuromonas sp.]